MATVPINLAASAYNAASKMGGAGKAGSSDTPLGNVAGAASSAASVPSFGDMVGAALDKARDTQYKTESLSVGSVANQAQLHELVTAVTDAELTLQTVVSVRDKMINAYQDILKMPI